MGVHFFIAYLHQEQNQIVIYKNMHLNPFSFANEAFLLEPKKDEIFLGNENKSFHLKENLREKKTNNEEIKDGVNEET